MQFGCDVLFMDTTPLILLPGTLCDTRLWAAQVAALSSQRTVQVGDLTRDDSISAMAAWVLAAAPPRFALAGLSLAGEADVICPSELHAELAARIPDAQFLRLRGCGHLSTHEQPAHVTEVLNAWLAAGLEAPLA